MEIKDLKNLGKLCQEPNADTLITCPKCKGNYGAKKWAFLATDKGLECPGCNSLFEKDVPFETKPVTRVKKAVPVKAEVKDNVVARERLSVSALGGSKTN